MHAEAPAVMRRIHNDALHTIAHGTPDTDQMLLLLCKLIITPINDIIVTCDPTRY